MYTEFFGLRELPFELTPDPRFLFLTGRHREGLAHLRHALISAKGLALLVGDAGTGKTTMLRSALQEVERQSVKYLYLCNPALTREEFVEFLARGFALSPKAAQSKTALLIELEQTIPARREQGEVMAIVIDEAQSLPPELLEEVRLLANLETATKKLLPVVLAGQPELAQRLNEPAFRQLKQRIALRCELKPLSLDETASYIIGRARTAGGDATTMFTREALLLIHERSRGIPRTINVICDNALVTGFALQQRPVTSEVVMEVCQDFDLPGDGKSDDRGLGAKPSPAGIADVTSERATVSGQQGAPPVARRQMFAFLR